MTQGGILVIEERNKQIIKGRTIEDDIQFNDREQLASFVRLLLHCNNLNNIYIDRFIFMDISKEKRYNPDFNFKDEVLVEYMKRPYEERVKIAGAVCIAELDRLLNL